MSWLESINDPMGGLAIVCIVAIIAIAWLIGSIVSAIADIKVAKYESFAAAVGYDYDLYEFARWLNEQDGTANYETYVDRYIEETARSS